VLVDHLKEDGRAGGGRECAELPCDGSAHAHLNVTHRRVLPVRRHARTDGATGKTIEKYKYLDFIKSVSVLHSFSKIES
jgi:hypothetical protein